MIFCRGLILLLLFDLNLVAQTFITNNDWDFHLNIRDVNHMALYNNSIYCFSSNGLFSVDLESKNIQRNSNSLELENYKVVKTYQDSNYFILALQNGKLVIYNSGSIDKIDLEVTNNEIQINSLSIYNDVLYVSSSLGLYLISLRDGYVLENYKDIGENANSLNILESLIINDQIYLTSSTGVYILESNNANPLDYRSWKKLNFNLDLPFGIFTDNNTVYFYSKNRIYDSEKNIKYYNDSITIKKVKNINSQVYITYNNSINFKDYLGRFNNSEIININLPEEIDHISDFIYADRGLWISGKNFSLYGLDDQEFFSPANNLNILPDKIFSLDKDIYATKANRISFNTQNKGWENISFDKFKNITSVTRFNNDIYFSSSDQGILNYDKSFIIDESYENSLLVSESGNGVNVSDILSAQNKLWILNYGSLSPLLSFDINNNWQFYDLQNSSPLYPTAFKSNDEFLWILLDKNKGGGIIVYDILTQESFELNEKNNLLNSNYVNDITTDKNDNVWVATDEGLIYFSSYNPRLLTNYIIPNDGSQYLFKGIKINTIEDDYAGNIWIGTENGIFVFDNRENKFLFHFNLSNSPLLSDTIQNIKFNDLGSAYINTSDGLVSVNTSLEKPKKDLSNFKIYPNPLKIKQNDRLYFSGLSDGNYIKITSLSGEKIIEIETYSGGFSWDLISPKGNKISPGIYLVFLVSQNGYENLINKILVL